MCESLVLSPSAVAGVTEAQACAQRARARQGNSMQQTSRIR